MTYNLRRAQRITAARDIQRVLRDGSAHRKNYGVIRVVRRTRASSQARLALGISKHSVGSAVRRNLVKRIIREWFRLHQAQIPTVDYLVLSTPKLGRCRSSVHLTRELRSGLDQFRKDLTIDGK